MKKELIVAIIVLVLILLTNFLTQKYTKNSVEEVDKKTKELKELVISMNKDEEVLLKKIKEINEVWNEKKQILSYYIEHNELEKIDSKIYLISGNIENDNYDQILQDVDDMSFILNHIVDKYKFSMKNVF